MEVAAVAEEAAVEEEATAVAEASAAEETPAETPPTENESTLTSPADAASAAQEADVGGITDMPTAKKTEGSTKVEIRVEGMPASPSAPGEPQVGRVAGGTAIGVGLGSWVLSYSQVRKFKEAQQRYWDVPETVAGDDVALLIVNEEVVPAQRKAIVFFASGCVAIGGGIFLWTLDDITVMPGPTGLTVSGSW